MFQLGFEINHPVGSIVVEILLKISSLAQNVTHARDVTPKLPTHLSNLVFVHLLDFIRRKKSSRPTSQP